MKGELTKIEIVKEAKSKKQLRISEIIECETIMRQVIIKTILNLLTTPTTKIIKY